MRVSVIGCGYLGAVHAVCLAAIGHDVVGVDHDRQRVAALAAGRAPFFEPGLSDLLTDPAIPGTVAFHTDMSAAQGADVHFLCVGTPQRPDGLGADLSQLWTALNALLPFVRPGDLVVGKSTVPVGTAQSLAKLVSHASGTLVWNPEFLREGFAIEDTLRPDRLVYGVPTRADREPTDEAIAAIAKLDAVYHSVELTAAPHIVTDYATAELTKTAANAFLATKISFINAMADLCEATGADVGSLAEAIGFDPRIGHRFLGAGLGFGGGCLPKDIRALEARALELGVSETAALIRQVDTINTGRRRKLVEHIRAACGGTVMGKTIALLGMTFKPATDDLRDSPAIEVAVALADAGAQVQVTDPIAVDAVADAQPRLQPHPSARAAATDADVVVLCTEWQEYKNLDPADLADVVAHRQIVDGRNALDARAWRAAGWTYRGMGRP